MPITNERWDVCGEAINKIFKWRPTSAPAREIRDLMIDAKMHIIDLEKEVKRLSTVEAMLEETQKKLKDVEEMHEVVKTEVDVRKRIQHELRAIILLAINPE